MRLRVLLAPFRAFRDARLSNRQRALNLIRERREQTELQIARDKRASSRW